MMARGMSTLSGALTRRSIRQTSAEQEIARIVEIQFGAASAAIPRKNRPTAACIQVLSASNVRTRTHDAWPGLGRVDNIYHDYS